MRPRFRRPGEPTSLQIALALLAGIVLGALGGGFLDGAVLVAVVLAACGVWRAAGHLAEIAHHLRSMAREDVERTMRMPR